MDNATKNDKITRIFKKIEEKGNKLPHPMWIFIILIITTLLLSLLLSKMNVSVTYMEADKDGAIVETTANVINLLSKENMASIFSNFTKNILSNPVLGNVITISMFMIIAEETGFFSSFFRRALLGAPTSVITFSLALIGICANIAGDAGNLLAATLGAVVFKAVGRNPVIGVVTAFSAASAGYTANLAIANQDITLAMTTGAAAESLGYTGFHPLINWYFMVTATFVLALVTTIICEKIVTPLIGDYEIEKDISAMDSQKISDEEARGLKFAGIATIIFFILLLLGSIPKNGIFRNSDGTLLPKSPLISSIVALVALFFGIIGTAYGFGSNQINNWNDIPSLMKKGIQRVSSMILILAWVSQFVELFKQSNLATILSVKGEQLLTSINLNGIPLLIIFIFFVTLLNIFMTSGSNKWFILAPIFIPMFARMGIHPALTQVCYRIGDSCTNNISPLSSTIPIAIALVEQYWPKDSEIKPGLGTVISYQLPYSIGYLITFIVLMVIFYTFNIPLGPAIPQL